MPAPQDRPALDWMPVDNPSDDLAPDAASAWELYLDSKKALREALQYLAPVGYDVVMVERRDRLAIAFAPAKRTASGKPRVSLAQWQASQDANGRSR